MKRVEKNSQRKRSRRIEKQEKRFRKTREEI